MKKIAIIGVGNLLMGDDGMGIHVVNELRKRDFPSNIEIADAMTNAFMVLEYLDGKDKGIIIDAYEGGRKPGTVYIKRLDKKLDRFADDFNLSLHDFKFMDALKSGREAYDLPEEIVFFGIEPDKLEPQIGLSEKVQEAVPEVIEKIMEELGFKSS